MDGREIGFIAMPGNEKVRYVTVEAIAGSLSCSVAHVRKLIIDGKLEAIKIGTRAIRVSEKSLHRFIEMQRVNPEDLYDPDKEKPR